MFTPASADQGAAAVVKRLGFYLSFVVNSDLMLSKTYLALTSGLEVALALSNIFGLTTPEDRKDVGFGNLLTAVRASAPSVLKGRVDALLAR